MPNEYRLYERQPTIETKSVPVGSVVMVDGKKTYTRDIATQTHIFAPTPQYQALGIDDVVVKHLESDGVEAVRFYVADKGEAWTVPTALYSITKAKKIKGREQRFVATSKFDKQAGESIPRPQGKLVV